MLHHVVVVLIHGKYFRIGIIIEIGYRVHQSLRDTTSTWRIGQTEQQVAVAVEHPMAIDDFHFAVQIQVHRNRGRGSSRQRKHVILDAGTAIELPLDAAIRVVGHHAGAQAALNTQISGEVESGDDFRRSIGIEIREHQ